MTSVVAHSASSSPLKRQGAATHFDERSVSTRKSARSRFSTTTRRYSQSSVDSFTDVTVGDQCETVQNLTVRQLESMDSPKIGEIPLGVTVEVAELGAGRRVKVLSTFVTGWISTRTTNGTPLIMKRSTTIRVQDDFEVGGRHEVKSHVTVRETESLESTRLFELRKGEVFTIMAISPNNKRRAKIKTDHGRQGWISLATREGELLVGKVNSGNKKGWFTARADNDKIRDILEGAMTGDVDAVKAVIEAKTNGFMSKPYDYPNCTDLRGKTPLIYAANYGSEEVVNYLVAQPKIKMDAMDDTQKTALHHACKYSGESAAPDQNMESIVRSLEQGGADVEARDVHGCTPMMYAAANGDQAIVQILLDAGANINHTDYEGHGAMQYAIEFGYEDLAKMLYKRGAIVAEEDELAIVDPDRYAELEEEEDFFNLVDLERPSLGIQPVQEVAAASQTSSRLKASVVTYVRDPLAPVGTPSSNGSAPSSSSGAPAPAAAKPAGKKKAKGKKKAASAAAAAGGAAAPGPPAKKPKKTKAGKAFAAMKAEKASEEANRKGKGTKKEVIALIDNEKEEVAPQELARQKLIAIMDVNPTAVELELAIKAAESVEGVCEVALQNARQMLDQKQAADSAAADLQQALDTCEVERMEAAIAAAEKAGVPAGMIKSAKAKLAAERPKEEARKELRAAQDSGNLDALKKAIAKAGQAKMDPQELAPYEHFLEGASNKDKVEKELAQAIEDRDVTMLKLQIQAAKDVGVAAAQISQAEQVLREEEPKVKAREVLTKAVEKGKKDKIREAIAAAKSVNVEQRMLDWGEAAVRELERQESQMQEVKKVMDSIANVNMKDYDALSAAKKQLVAAIADAKKAGVPEQSLGEVELKRRKLHNAMEDLKGAIRVFCRVRPLSKKEKDQGDTDVTKSPNPMKVIVDDKDFVFDAVFKPGTQGEVFEACRDLVQSAIDGYNVTMFAYGQTGAGKTFTMYGVPDQPGTAPQTIQEVFDITHRDAGRYTFTVTGSMMELYNSALVDLLAKEKRGKNAEMEALGVRADKDGNVVIEGLLEEQCTTAEAFQSVLDRGNKARTVAATAMNADSSRSHLIIVIKIVSVNKETSKMVRGKILLVDLAGSERLKKSKVTDAGQKEAIEINKSLTALGDVIEGLTKKDKGQVIPYRNHKLTMLMQDALGGTAKTLMFVNCSPANSNAEETIMSLKWAQRAKQITNNQVSSDAASQKSKPKKKK